MTHMKKILYLFLTCILIAACDLEVLDNGKMDGNWQLRQIDTLASKGVCDMTHSYIYWGIQDELLQVRDIDNSNQRIFFHYNKLGDSLTIHSPYLAITKNELEPVEDIEILLPLGITSTEDHFYIEKLNGGTMILKNECYRLHFRKY
jgi:hypothetical protein